MDGWTDAESLKGLVGLLVWVNWLLVLCRWTGRVCILDGCSNVGCLILSLVGCLMLFD